MRRPNRNIEIFSMSVLDMFASALGGFILIAIILFPNYIKEQKVRQELEDSKLKLEQTEKKLTETERVAAEVKKTLEVTEISLKEKTEALSACEAGKTIAERGLAACQSAMARTFLFAIIEWDSCGDCDVDLHVIDPKKQEYDWVHNNRNGSEYPGSSAQLSYDNTRGPAIELWQDPKAEPGTYKIDYVYYRAGYGSVKVRGNVFYRNGRITLPDVTLSKQGDRRHVADVIIGEDGIARVRW